MKKPFKKLVTLIDRQNKVIGEEKLLNAHTHPAQLHRAVSVWLIRNLNKKKQVLFQKRATNKIVGANQWGNAVCGNVHPHETYLECAQRRLLEEIGISKITLQPSYRFEYKIYGNKQYGEHELDQVYLAQYDGKLTLNPHEVSVVEWIDLAELKKETSQHKIMPAQKTLNKTTLQLKNLTPSLLFKLKNKVFEIAPWTVLMLGDKRLWKSLEKF